MLAALPAGDLGGTETNFLRYARHLRDRVRYRLVVWRCGTGRLLVAAAREGIESRVVGAPPFAWRHVAEWAWEADLLHSFLLRGHLLLAPHAVAGRRPWLAAERGVEAFRGPAARALRARLLARADFVLPNAPSVLARLREVDGVEEARIRLVPSGVDLPPPAEPPPPNDPPRVLCVAHLRPEKGVDVLLAAWRKYRAEGGTATLDVVGGGLPLGEAEGVRFLGEVPNAAERMPEYDLLVLPSREEGFPNVVVEAQARCVPVLASDVPGVRAFVEDGATGFLFPVGDADALARRLHEVLQDETARRRAARAGRAVAERYDARVAAERLHAIYEEAMRRYSPS